MTDTITLPRSVVQGALDALRDYKRSDDDRVSVAMGILQDALREALEQPQRVNQCGETCERAKLCAVCARGLNEQPDQPCKRCNAYATLVKAQEKQLSHHRGQADKYREAIDTLHSERQANATLTEELEQFRAQNAQPQQEPGAREHITDGNSCWCEPEINYKDPETGISVIVHKEPQ